MRSTPPTSTSGASPSPTTTTPSTRRSRPAASAISSGARSASATSWCCARTSSARLCRPTRPASLTRSASRRERLRLHVYDLATVATSSCRRSARSTISRVAEQRVVLYGDGRNVWATRADGTEQPERVLARVAGLLDKATRHWPPSARRFGSPGIGPKVIRRRAGPFEAHHVHGCSMPVDSVESTCRGRDIDAAARLGAEARRLHDFGSRAGDLSGSPRVARRLNRCYKVSLTSLSKACLT